ncbi:unnamed protein product [Auanema sp. JU1783]|nr:unnamed protein product [Auanema sp. JU1783]
MKMRFFVSAIFLFFLINYGTCDLLDKLLSKNANNHEKVTSKLHEKALETVVENDNASKISTDLIDPAIAMFNNETGTAIRAKRYCGYGCCGGCCGCGTYAPVTYVPGMCGCGFG